MKPVMNKFTRGLNGELVVRLTIIRTSPFGIPLVSRVSFNFPVWPGLRTGGFSTSTALGLSVSTLYITRSLFPTLEKSYYTFIVLPAAMGLKVKVFSLKSKLEPFALSSLLQSEKSSLVTAHMPIFWYDLPFTTGVNQ